ncbi:hypothetical protein K525DRAFT_214867, partial [Schizophyllum commune Loenen D]
PDRGSGPLVRYVPPGAFLSDNHHSAFFVTRETSKRPLPTPSPPFYLEKSHVPYSARRISPTT